MKKYSFSPSGKAPYTFILCRPFPVVNEKKRVFALACFFRKPVVSYADPKEDEGMETIAKLWPLWAALGLMNLVTFIVYAYDKHIARQQKGKRRVPERTLLLLAFLGGCVGAALGMSLCRHKTKQMRFLILVPLSVLLWAAAVGALILHLLGIF